MQKTSSLRAKDCSLQPTFLSCTPLVYAEDITWIAPLVSKGSFPLPLYGARVSAGFRSPADDYLETALDLNEYCIQHPTATFMVRVSGQCLLELGIHDGDLLVVDRSLEALPGHVVIAVVDGELTAKQLQQDKEGNKKLCPANPDYAPLVLNEHNDVIIWGVVTHVIHDLKR